MRLTRNLKYAGEYQLSDDGDLFFASKEGGSYQAATLDGGDLGTGSMQSITRFRSQEAREYWLQAEDARAQVNGLLQAVRLANVMLMKRGTPKYKIREFLGKWLQ